MADTHAEDNAGHVADEAHGAAEAGAHGADAAHGADVAHAADAAHGTVGMPQLDPSSFGHQIFWLIIALIAIYYLLTRIAIPRIGGTIENRQRAISRDLDRAAELKKQAEAADKAYADSLRAAKTQAAGIADQAKAKAQAEIDKRIEEADAELAKANEASKARIAAIKDEADQSISEVARETARALAEALLPGSVDGSALDKAVGSKVKG